MGRLPKCQQTLFEIPKERSFKVRLKPSDVNGIDGITRWQEHHSSTHNRMRQPHKQTVEES